MKLTLLHSVPAFKALMEWYRLEAALKEFLDDREISFFSYSISSTGKCLICSLYFRQILSDQGIDFDTFSFTEKEQLLVDFGKSIADDPHHIGGDIYTRLKEAWNDEQIVLLTAFAAMMKAANLINDILKVDVDDRLIPYMSPSDSRV